ncbi:MAG: sn-glycerol-3-phosphate ABC transporter ATP-binding protein UgpC [Myxococcales bacterium]|nr:sn-glycerol-3-phosphate ABC transporter ATP-binding protein UgpC [Myxococcales bacterium]
MASVTLAGINKRFDDVHVVHDLDLAVDDGELVVLVGPSGCGKSTTLRMVAGLEGITSGELRIGDRVVNDLSPRDRDIAMVFQSYALYPHMTVYENMAFGLRIRKMAASEIDSRVQEAAKLLGLSDLLQRRPKALSGGQRQRVAMGRAVVREPAVFLFDEPLSNLDAKLRVAMRLEVARLHKRLGATIMYVTHDQVEAMTLADRIAVMSLGVLQQCASPDEVYRRPTNTFVATFIGSPAMNLFPVTSTTAADGQVTMVGRGIQMTWTSGAEQAMPGELTVGVRPQDLQVVAESDADLHLRVDVLEPLGAETFVYGALEGGADGATGQRDAATQERCASPFIVRLPPDQSVRSGDLLHLKLALPHFFDTQGERLSQFDD